MSQRFFFALLDIDVGEEVKYNHGGVDFPWRKVGFKQNSCLVL